MAARRMFSKRLTESTKFLKMPATSQNLYFHLGMNADDDGVVEALLVMRTVGATEDDLRIIVSKGFATVLNEDMVTYLNDWRENNNIRADRKIDSIYKELLLSIIPDISLVESKPSYYSRKKVICQTNDGQVTDVCPPRLGKDRIDQNRLDNTHIRAREDECLQMFEKFWNTYPKQASRALAEQAYVQLLSTTEGLREEQVVAAAKNYAEACKILKMSDKFIYMPHNWLDC